MIPILLFLRTLVLLTIEGAAFAAILVPSGTWLLPLALSLPLAACLNVLLVFSYTVSGVPLTGMTLLGGHLIITAALIVTVYRRPSLLMDQTRPAHVKLSRGAFAVTAAAVLLIGMNVVYSFSHAVLLPSNQYDSATNWTMRSEISFYDQKIAFDTDESRGMAKPQYPFLYHALQVTGNGSLTRWSDTAANTILYLLSLGTFVTLYALLRRIRRREHAAATIAAIIGLPILGLHLAQGYGDLNLIQYLLLSLACLGVWAEEAGKRRGRWLTLSGIFIAAAVWTKSEGSVFGLLPWLLTVGAISLRNRSAIPDALRAAAVAVALSIPWPIFASLRGLSLTPHSSDTLFGFHSEGVSEAILGLLSRGSFGIHVYALAFLIPCLIIAARRKHPLAEARQLPMLIIGAVTFVQVLFIYLFTPNVRFLLDAQSYYRQMMVPLALLVLACGLLLKSEKESH